MTAELGLAGVLPGARSGRKLPARSLRSRRGWSLLFVPRTVAELTVRSALRVWVVKERGTMNSSCSREERCSRSLAERLEDGGRVKVRR